VKISISNHKCPNCQNFLYFKEIEENRVQIWCGQPDNICNNQGANDGAVAKNEDSAFTILMQKLGYE